MTSSSTKGVSKISKHYEIIYPEDLPRILKGVRKVAIDTETTGLDWVRDELVYMTITTRENNGYLLKFESDEDKYYPEVDKFLRDRTIGKVFHKAQFDVLFLEKYGYKVEGIVFDTKIAAYVLNPTKPNGLKDLAREYLGEEPGEFEELFPKGMKIADRDIRKVDIQRVVQYACDDSNNTFRLEKALRPLIYGDDITAKIFEIDLKVSGILTRCIQNGMAVDPKVLENLKESFTKKVQMAEVNAREYLGDINLNSPVQLVDALYSKDGLYLPIHGFTYNKNKRTCGNPSTDEECLTYLIDEHPVIQHILDYKKFKKLLNTYVGPIAEALDQDYLLHGGLNQCTTVTGRLSSSDPNLQNIPQRSEEGRMIRRAFVSRFRGGKLVVADYSQFELRIMAHFSEDPVMMKAYIDAHEKGEEVDFHQYKADQLGISRSDGKTMNFAMVYNVGAKKLSRDIGKDVETAQEFLDRDAEKFKGVTAWKEKTVDFATENGYVTTILGRKLYIGETKYEGTTGVNYPIQGSASDIIKMAMIDIQDWLDAEGLKTLMLLQVHDELIFDCPPNEVELVAAAVKSMMENIIELRVPIVADTKVVDSWGEAKD